MANKTYSETVNSKKYIILPNDFDSDKISDIVVEMDGSALRVNSDYEVTRNIDSETYCITWEALPSTAIEEGKTLDVTYPYVESETVETPTETPTETPKEDTMDPTTEVTEPSNENGSEKETAEDREKKYSAKKEAINVAIPDKKTGNFLVPNVAHMERRVFPRWSFAKMSGNHRTEGEFMFARYVVDDEKYFTNDVVVDDYPDPTTGKVNKDRNRRIQKDPSVLP